MNTTKSYTHYKKYYRLLALAAIIMIMVIIGSLVTGSSIRSSLRLIVEERLGTTETVIFSSGSFIDHSIMDAPLLSGAKAILLSKGFVSAEGRLIPVMVWGIDDNSLTKGGAKVNAALAGELGKSQSDLVLRLPATGLTPSGSLFVTDNYTTSLRLEYLGTIESGGNISLKNEQIIPFNIFVSRAELAATLETENKINLILHDKQISKTDFANIWNYTHSGLAIKQKQNFVEIVSDRIFLQKDVVERIIRNNPQSNRVFSYLVNSIEHGNRSVPYSFAVAVDRYEGLMFNRVVGKNGEMAQAIVSDYTATRLNLKQHDTLRLSYFVSHDLKTLDTARLQCAVAEIIPLEKLHADSTLSADFPGLSNVENCTDWNSDMPINMSLIGDEDEKYWDLYKATPKIILSYPAVADDWSNSYGSATAIRIDGEDANMSGLTPEMFGIQLIYPRETGLAAARSGIDFAGLFLALGIFIIISAILLMIVPFSEMLHQRRDEISLLQSLGYKPKRIASMFRREALRTMLAASAIGVVAGLVYTRLILFLLGNVWNGATHTAELSFLPDTTTVATGLAVSIFMAMAVLWRLTRPAVFAEKRDVLPLKRPSKRNKRISGNGKLPLIAVGIPAACVPLFLKSTESFVLSGILTIAFACLLGRYILYRRGAGTEANRGVSHNRLIWATLYAGRKQSRFSFLTLASGVFIIFSVGLNRQNFTDNAQLAAGTGGYSLWCENSVPVYHNINTLQGREKLALTELPAETEVMQIMKFDADDASCLNLNKVSKPTVLGVDMNALAVSNFEIASSLYSGSRTDIFKSLQTVADSIFPALVDETVLMWNLGLKLGDTINYETENGKHIVLKLAGTLKNSIFQGNLLIDGKLFAQAWSEITGSEIMLLKTAENKIDETKKLISQAMNEYGVRVSTTASRLQEFNSVMDTYLSIFMTLGCLGLLLGIMSFVIVIRKNLTARQYEIASYRALGFPDEQIGKLLYNENIIVPLYAIVVGVVASLIGAAANLANAGIMLWITVLFYTALFVVGILIFTDKAVQLRISDINRAE
ncbi:MAG: ABC transporter permease [Prevotellaceae bacterium]|jgi:putative ABC transport system permease protein|nr:ABC transporter permease [Prevotellaceae bacterium]